MNGSRSEYRYYGLYYNGRSLAKMPSNPNFVTMDIDSAGVYHLDLEHPTNVQAFRGIEACIAGNEVLASVSFYKNFHFNEVDVPIMDLRGNDDGITAMYTDLWLSPGVLNQLIIKASGACVLYISVWGD